MTDPITAMFEEERALVRVYRLPGKLTDGYCFGSGVPITFVNVDWFEAPVSGSADTLTNLIKGKRYYRPDHRFLVLGDHPNFVFTIDVDPSRPVLAEDRRP